MENDLCATLVFSAFIAHPPPDQTPNTHIAFSGYLPDRASSLNTDLWTREPARFP